MKPVGGRTWRTGIGTAGACILTFLYAPIVVIILGSFLHSDFGVIRFDGLTLQWYRQLFNNRELMGTVVNSLRVCIPAVIIATSVGTYAAFVFHRFRFRGTQALMGLLVLPYIMPGIITGVSLALVFRQLGMPASLLTVGTGLVVVTTPFAMYLVYNRLSQLDPTIEDAARDLGASPARVLFQIIIPNILTAILGAALLGFTIAFDDIAVSVFLVGEDLTLPVKVWTLLRFGYSPEINALYSIIFFLSIGLIAAAARTVVKGVKSDA